jgi:hypothetical protein
VYLGLKDKKPCLFRQNIEAVFVKLYIQTLFVQKAGLKKILYFAAFFAAIGQKLSKYLNNT